MMILTFIFANIIFLLPRHRARATVQVLTMIMARFTGKLMSSGSTQLILYLFSCGPHAFKHSQHNTHSTFTIHDINRHAVSDLCFDLLFKYLLCLSSLSLIKHKIKFIARPYTFSWFERTVINFQNDVLVWNASNFSLKIFLFIHEIKISLFLFNPDSLRLFVCQ